MAEKAIAPLGGVTREKIIYVGFLDSSCNSLRALDVYQRKKEGKASNNTGVIDSPD